MRHKKEMEKKWRHWDRRTDPGLFAAVLPSPEENEISFQVILLLKAGQSHYEDPVPSPV